MTVAVVTGASKGFGRAFARALAERDWQLILTARGARELDGLAAELGAVGMAGDVCDPEHRRAVASAAEALGGADLLVNNASDLGPSPLPRLADIPLAQFRAVFEVNVFAPLAMVQLLPDVHTVVNLSSDAAVEAYVGWGCYGSAKAALDQLGAVLAVERPRLLVYSFDPGDMRTDLHQRAFPGEDISDRPEPELVVPALLGLLDSRLPSGRYRASDLLAAATP